MQGANVTVTFNQTDMQMPEQEYQLSPRGHGVYLGLSALALWVFNRRIPG